MAKGTEIKGSGDIAKARTVSALKSKPQGNAETKAVGKDTTPPSASDCYGSK